MPSDIVSIVVSTGVGVSVLAGILSGVCYILAHGHHYFQSTHHEESHEYVHVSHVGLQFCSRWIKQTPEELPIVSGVRTRTPAASVSRQRPFDR
nr:unnamed protein product [Callosobruchus chinensis]